MNYTTITLEGQKVGLKFGMASFRYLSEKFVEGISFKNGEITEIGISHLIYAGYYNNCLVKDVIPEITLEQIVDYVEIHIKDESFFNEIKEVLKVWGDSDIIKKSAEIVNAENEGEKTKKKNSRGMK